MSVSGPYSKTIQYIKLQPVSFEALCILYAMEKGHDINGLTPYQEKQIAKAVRSILYNNREHITITGKGKNIYHYNK